MVTVRRFLSLTCMLLAQGARALGLRALAFWLAMASIRFAVRNLRAAVEALEALDALPLDSEGGR